MVDWNDNKNRKVFRQALQAVYPNDSALEIFVDEELNENLAAVAGGDNLQVTAHGLVKWARAKGQLDNVYNAFKAENPTHPVIEELEREDTFQVQQESHLSPDDWQSLFDQFVADDLADLRRSFLFAFREVMHIDFKLAQRNAPPPLTDRAQIRELLEDYDRGKEGPELAVRFVEFAINELQRSDKEQIRDLKRLQDWRNRIAQKFQVKELPAVKQTVAYAYLLITLEQYGKDVIAYPELRITDRESKILFDAQPMEPCSINQVIDSIIQWINLAEATPEVSQCQDREVILELFLRNQHIVDNVVPNWKVAINDEKVSLSCHRRYLIRSADRISDYQLQSMLTEAWAKLQGCVSQDVCEQFHTQRECPQQGAILTRYLKNKKPPGLKFLAQLPPDLAKRRSVLGGMINAPVPIVLWSAASTEAVAREFESAFDTFLKSCDPPTNFVNVATQWNNHCINHETNSEKHIKLLCDCPDRWPQLPDIKHQKTTEDEDSIAIVA